MIEKHNALSRSYAAALRVYVAQGAHGNSRPAVKLGNDFVAIGLETVDLARTHAEAVRQIVTAEDSSKVRARITKWAGKFLIEAMVPFTASHRASMNGNANPDRRTAELVASNARLKLEIERRKAAELALKEKERHVSDMLEQALRMQEHLRQLSRDLLSTQEEERKTISRELHDDIAQTLTGINVHLATLKNEAAINAKGLTKKIVNTQRIVKKSVEIVHRFARKLRPTMLDDLGLIPALNTYIKDFTRRTEIPIGFSAFTGIEQLASVKRTVVYRVIQSALTNVAQHAQAKHVKVSILVVRDFVCLEIKDDGKSFLVQKVMFAKKKKRLGLLGMRERVEMVGGSFSVESEPGRGTAVRARIPFSEDMKE